MPNSLRTITVATGFHTSAYHAILTIDTDTNANRVVVLDRNTMDCYANKEVHTAIVKIRVPAGFVNNNNLVVGIVDDDSVYDCKFADGVRAETLMPITAVIR